MKEESRFESEGRGRAEEARSPMRPQLVRFGPGRRIPGHVHPRWSVAVPVQGVLYEDRKCERVGAVAGEALTIAPGIWHENAAGHRGCLHLLLEITEHTGLDARMAPGVGRLPEHSSSDARKLVLVLEAEDPDERLVDELARSIVEDLSSSRRRVRHGPSPPWLQQARQRVLDDPLDPPELAELAAMAGLHPSTVLRAFRSAYGATPALMARRHRLEAAARLLESTPEQVGRIALRLGFSDQSHLTRAFRQAFGVTPAMYRHARQEGTHGRPSYRSPESSD